MYRVINRWGIAVVLLAVVLPLLGLWLRRAQGLGRLKTGLVTTQELFLPVFGRDSHWCGALRVWDCDGTWPRRPDRRLAGSRPTDQNEDRSSMRTDRAGG